MTLDDFEPAAIEATHVLRVVRTFLCTLAGPDHDPLRTTLANGGVEIADVIFTEDTMTRVAVHVQAQPKDGPSDVTTPIKSVPKRWLLQLVRGPERWRFVSLALD